MTDAKEWLIKNPPKFGPLEEQDYEYIAESLEAYASSRVAALEQRIAELEKLAKYVDHDPDCPEFRQQPNRHNKGMVLDSAFPCRCGLTDLLARLREVK